LRQRFDKSEFSYNEARQISHELSMKQLIVQVVDTDKAEMLSRLLTALDFVNSVEIQEQSETKIDNEQDFLP